MSDDEIVIEEPELAPYDPMRAFLPKAFGKQKAEANIEAQIDRSRRPVEKAVADNVPVDKGKAKAGLVAYGDSDDDSDDSDDGYGPQPVAKPESDSDSDDDDDDDDESDAEDAFPMSHEMIIKTHTRAVTSVSLDPAGGRLASGSLDCTVRLHDFASMTPTTIRAFRTIDPWEAKSTGAVAADSQPVHSVSFSPSGSHILVTGGHPQAKVLTREGEVAVEFVKGDMYLKDMRNTTGHISEVTMGCWHPEDRNLLVTGGTDSTVRIWDMNNRRKQKDIIVFKAKSASQNSRIRITALKWANTPSGSFSTAIVAAADDGSLVMYPGNGPFWRPAAEIPGAHTPGTWTSGLDVSSDGRMVVTRGGDDTIKLWDLRNFTKPLVTVAHETADVAFPMSNICYAPNSTSILVGSNQGNLHILNPANLRPEVVAPITPNHAVIAVGWHPKLNQIATSSADGSVHMLYNPDKSQKGAKDVMSRAPKRRHIDDDPSLTVDLTGGMAFTTTQPTQKRGGKSKEARRPEMPSMTPFMKNRPDEKHIQDNIPLAKMLHEDPREALLKYAEVAKKDPMFTKAWNDTQPVTEYAEISDNEEDKDGGPARKKTKYIGH